jgi:1-acyl-sn-glycerol-3-phosphate acyltransferase
MKIKKEAGAESMPFIRAGLLKGFSAYSRSYLRRHFHSIRILKTGLPLLDPSFPLVIYLNHASWWDPLVCLLLARHYFPSRNSFAPIDEAALKRYSFFRQLGFYGIEQKSVSGAMKFLQTTRGLLSSARNIVWLTPQGRFMDVRQRPLRFEGGLGKLASKLKNVAFLPLAVEYAFWTEPRPEILVGFGRPIVSDHAALPNAGEWKELFEKALGEAQENLAASSCRRDPTDWILLDKGRSGISAVYDAWRWIRSRVQGVAFVRGHKTEEWT